MYLKQSSHFAGVDQSAQTGGGSDDDDDPGNPPASQPSTSSASRSREEEKKGGKGKGKGKSSQDRSKKDREGGGSDKDRGGEGGPNLQLDDGENELEGLETLHMYGQDPDPDIPPLRRSSRNRNRNRNAATSESSPESDSTLLYDEEDVQEFRELLSEYSVVVLTTTTVMLFLCLLGIWKCAVFLYRKAGCCWGRSVRARQVMRDRVSVETVSRRVRQAEATSSSHSLPLPPYPDDSSMEDVELYAAPPHPGPKPSAHVLKEHKM